MALLNDAINAIGVSFVPFPLSFSPLLTGAAEVSTGSFLGRPLALAFGFAAEPLLDAAAELFGGGAACFRFSWWWCFRFLFFLNEFLLCRRS